MPNAIRIALFGLLLGGAATAARSQAQNPRMPTDEAGKLARYYETFAAKTLSRYYEEATFLVKAKVEMEPPAGAPDPDFDLGSGGAEPPPQLPGLPFLPESSEPSLPAETGSKDASAGPSTVTLDVLVDTSYSERDIEFVGSLLAMATHLDETRGDIIKVHEGVFPRDNRALRTYRKPMDDEPPARAARPDSSAKAEGPMGAQAGGDKPPANPFSSYMDHLPSLIPLLVICLLILACVWMVSRAIVGSSRKERGGSQGLPAMPTLSAIGASAEAPKPAPSTTSPGSGRNGNGDGKQSSELASFRPFLLNCFVGNPKHCVQIIRSWIQRDSEKGLRDTGALVASLDTRLLGVLGPELGKDVAQKLEMHVQVGETPPAEELMVIYKEFKREFKNLSNGTADDDQYKDLFGFLQQMSEQQIMHILKDESMGIAGLVLAQLPPEAASGILQKVEPDNRAKLLISMGNIDNIPLNVYREIADRLSLKALDVGNMRYVAADGVDSILELIDNLPLNLQFNYIHSISEMDLGLAEKIRNRYVTLPEMVGLPDKFLAGILQSLDQETLITALKHADDALRRKVLGLLPERMQMMVSSGLEGSADSPPKVSEAAQKKILHRIRDEIRLSGRPA